LQRGKGRCEGGPGMADLKKMLALARKLGFTTTRLPDGIAGDLEVEMTVQKKNRPSARKFLTGGLTPYNNRYGVIGFLVPAPSVR
jgi:hypothetical protein